MEPSRRTRQNRRMTSPAVIDTPRIEGELLDAGADVIESDARLQGLAISGADVSGRKVERLEIANCVLSGLALTGTTLKNVDLLDVVFRECELSGCMFEEARLHRVLFQGCRMAASAFPEADLRNVAFDECRMNDAWLRMATLDRVRFEGCDLQNADLYRTTIRKSRFVSCDLSHAQFSGAMFDDVALHGSKLASIEGADKFRNLTIASDQTYDLALPIFADLHITIDDDYLAD